jgi:hypothetical protein
MFFDKAIKDEVELIYELPYDESDEFLKLL